WIEEIALWDVITVDPTPAAIVPRPCRDILQRVDRVRGAAEPVERLPEQVLVHTHLHRGLPLAGEVVAEAAAIGEVVPSQVLLRGEIEVAVRHQRRRADVLLRKAGAEVVVP